MNHGFFGLLNNMRPGNTTSTPHFDSEVFESGPLDFRQPPHLTLPMTEPASHDFAPLY